MAMVTIDASRCQGHGRCELIAPGVFALGDDARAAVVRSSVSGTEETNAQEAAWSCPEMAITVT